MNEMQLQQAVCGDVAWPEAQRVPAERIGEAVAAEFGVKPSDLHAHGHRAGIAKSLAVELCCMLSGKSQRDAARYYGYRTDGGVARQRRLLRQKMRNSPPLERRLAYLRKSLLQSKVQNTGLTLK